ncbi:MAG: hypothetical protein A3G93_08385 [Nitrospinae bacterium RIFCSPLOWO2_12_FULL_45_22]|nr:MAG: hypothetical protein A3G93_08385 [Nitrospinae bacterium RIFCSPLOWO2_12_FULL_45_22]
MKKKKKSPHSLLAYRAEEALKRAVAKAIAEHQRQGIPIAIWRDGKVVRVPPDQITVRDVEANYLISNKKRK